MRSVRMQSKFARLQAIQSAVKQSEAAWLRIICASRPIIIQRENDC